MEIITKGVVALCMFYQGGIIEHTYVKDQKMSTCLKMKRTVERSVNPQNVRMACGEIDAVLKCLNESTQMGKYAREFERKIADLFHKKHCLYVNSGSSANFITEFSALICPLITT